MRVIAVHRNRWSDAIAPSDGSRIMYNMCCWQGPTFIHLLSSGFMHYTYVARNYLPRGEHGKGISMMDNVFDVQNCVPLHCMNYFCYWLL